MFVTNNLAKRKIRVKRPCVPRAELIFSLTQISFGLVNLKRLRFISELTFMHGGRVGLVLKYSLLVA